jgi:hypothetical protein
MLLFIGKLATSLYSERYSMVNNAFNQLIFLASTGKLRRSCQNKIIQSNRKNIFRSSARNGLEEFFRSHC